MRMLRRAVVIVVLGLILAAPWASAEPVFKVTRSQSLLPSLWSFVARVWSAAGCWIDPLGRCLAGPQPPSADAGCGIDPLGCPAQISADEGCIIDPLGGCAPGQ